MSQTTGSRPFEINHGDLLPERFSDLMPHTASVRIGCATCDLCVTVNAHGLDCNKTVGDVLAAVELNGVPARALTLQGITSYDVACDSNTCGSGIREAVGLI